MYTGSLTALIYQHSITPISLPCKLVLPVIGESNVHHYYSVYTIKLAR